MCVVILEVESAQLALAGDGFGGSALSEDTGNVDAGLGRFDVELARSEAGAFDLDVDATGDDALEGPGGFDGGRGTTLGARERVRERTLGLGVGFGTISSGGGEG